MKLYVTRHGQTAWNAQNRVLGATDKPLNETGIAQASELAGRMNGLGIQKIYASPLQRAALTAEIAAQANGIEEIVFDDRLKEQNFGIFEGEKRDDPVYQAEKHQFFKPFENGESFLDVSARVYPFLKELKEKEADDAVVLIVCHGGIMRMIANYFEGMDNEQFADFFAENCQLMEFEL